MKQLCEVLPSISDIAKKTTPCLAEQKFSLTREDGKRITQTLDAYKHKAPREAVEETLAFLKLLLNTSGKPALQMETIFTQYGTEFVPSDIWMPEMTESEQKIAKRVVEVVCEPASKAELAELYTKLRLVTLHQREESPSDEKLRMVAYMEELSRFPASVVREVFRLSYDWFPSLKELVCECEKMVGYFDLLKRKVGLS